MTFLILMGLVAAGGYGVAKGLRAAAADPAAAGAAKRLWRCVRK